MAAQPIGDLHGEEHEHGEGQESPPTERTRRPPDGLLDPGRRDQPIAEKGEPAEGDQPAIDRHDRNPPMAMTTLLTRPDSKDVLFRSTAPIGSQDIARRTTGGCYLYGCSRAGTDLSTSEARPAGGASMRLSSSSEARSPCHHFGSKASEISRIYDQNLRYRGDLIGFDAIRSVRFTATEIRHSVNFIPTGTSFTSELDLVLEAGDVVRVRQEHAFRGKTQKKRMEAVWQAAEIISIATFNRRTPALRTRIHRQEVLPFRRVSDNARWRIVRESAASCRVA